MAFDPDKYLQSKKISTASLAPAPQEMSEDALSLGDLAAMAGQGATFKFGDEILGALKAAADVALTDEELSNIGNLYRQHQKEEEAKYEALAEAHPKTALAAELAGGFLVPAGFLAKGVKAGAEGAKLAGMALGGAETAKKAERAYKVLKAAEMGAKAGALAGAGSSKATLEDIGGLGKDVLTGAMGGTVLGGGLGVAGAGLSKAIEVAPEKIKSMGPLGENIVRAFEQSKAGRGFVNPESEKRILEEGKKAASELAEGLVEPSRKVSEEIASHLAEAEKIGAKVGIGDDKKLIEDISQLIKNTEGTGITEIPTIVNKRAFNAKKKALKDALDNNTIDQTTYTSELAALEKNPPLKKTALSGVSEALIQQTGVSPELAPHQLKSLSDDLQRLIKGELTPQEASNLAKKLSGEELGEGYKALDKRIQQLVPSSLPESIKAKAFESADTALSTPGKSAELMEKFSDVRRLLPETILNKGAIEKHADVYLSKFGAGPAALKKAETALNDEIKDVIINKLADPTSSADDVRGTMRALVERIDEVNKKYPELNLSLNSIVDKVKAAAQDRTIRAKILTKHGEKDSVEGIVDKLLNWSGYGGAIIAGKGAGVAQKGLKGFNNFITTASDASLMPIAKALQSTPKIDFLGHALEGALNNKSVAAKNAAIFSIMQNPEARKAIGKDMGFGSSED